MKYLRPDKIEKWRQEDVYLLQYEQERREAKEARVKAKAAKIKERATYTALLTRKFFGPKEIQSFVRLRASLRLSESPEARKPRPRLEEVKVTYASSLYKRYMYINVYMIYTYTYMTDTHVSLRVN